MLNFWQNLSKPFTVLAPMDGVTDYVFREIISDLAKPDVLFTEFISAKGLFSARNERLLYELQYSNNQKPIVAQIWGTQPELFSKAATLIENLGFDGIDINMGCPVKTVVKLGSGSALIKNKGLVIELIDAIKAGSKHSSVSVKTRIGFTEIETESWLGFLLEQKLDALTVHARIAKDMSSTAAAWGELKKVVTLRNEISPNTLIIGNGDVKNYQEVIDKHTNYLVDGVMIGRGVFSDPWVFDNNTLKQPHTSDDYLKLLLKHTKLFVDTYGTKRNFEDMKKFFKIYVRNFRGAKKLMNNLMRCRNYDEVEKEVNLLLHY